MNRWFLALGCALLSGCGPLAGLPLALLLVGFLVVGCSRVPRSEPISPAPEREHAAATVLATPSPGRALEPPALPALGPAVGAAVSPTPTRDSTRTRRGSRNASERPAALVAHDTQIPSDEIVDWRPASRAGPVWRGKEDRVRVRPKDAQ